MSYWQTDETHDPARTSWVDSAQDHGDFPIQNLPYGLFSPADGPPRAGVAIGDAILDLAACVSAGLIDCAPLLEDQLNALMALPVTERVALRRRISILLSNPAHRPAVEPLLHRAADCMLHLPARIGDYSDFYVGIHHANNIGRQFRPDNPLLPNYKYVPIGYHGCLLNDWSARDFQAWEYQPLGPFLAKNFHSTISPWVVTPEALAPFRIAQPPRPEGDPAPLPYLSDADDQAHGALALTLEVYLSTQAMRDAGQPPMRLSQGPASNMYWTVSQIVTHHASNGCNLMPGDLLGSGTISAPTREGYGSLMEISSGGREPISLPSGETRCFLEDGDEVTLRAAASAPGHVSIGFGECRAMIVPAR